MGETNWGVVLVVAVIAYLLWDRIMGVATMLVPAAVAPAAGAVPPPPGIGAGGAVTGSTGGGNLTGKIGAAVGAGACVAAGVGYAAPLCGIAGGYVAPVIVGGATDIAHAAGLGCTNQVNGKCVTHDEAAAAVTTIQKTIGIHFG